MSFFLAQVNLLMLHNSISIDCICRGQVGYNFMLSISGELELLRHRNPDEPTLVNTKIKGHGGILGPNKFIWASLSSLPLARPSNKSFFYFFLEGRPLLISSLGPD